MCDFRLLAILVTFPFTLLTHWGAVVNTSFMNVLQGGAGVQGDRAGADNLATLLTAVSRCYAA